VVSALPVVVAVVAAVVVILGVVEVTPGL
jgi:hypothetical protein